MKNKNLFLPILMCLLAVITASFPVAAYAADFDDAGGGVRLDAAFNDTAEIESGPAVDYAAAHGYLYLYADNEMAYPDNPLTRGEWAYTFERWLKYLSPLLTGMGFAPAEREVVLDDISGHPFYNSVNYLAARGLTEPDLFLFRPDDLVTRQEICDYMAKLLPMLNAGPDYALNVELILIRYGDRRELSARYEWPAAFMTEARLISGIDGMFLPKTEYTRGEMCRMLLAAEILLREKARERKADGLGISPDMEIDRANVSNITSAGYNVEITVNDAAVGINPYAVAAYITEGDSFPSEEDILSGGYYTQSRRLTEMRRIYTGRDEVTFSMTMRGQPDATYNLFIILKDGMDYSNMVEYTVRLPEAR